MTIAASIEAKLRRELSPSRLLVIDDTSKHAGHMGPEPMVETHFTVEIVSPRFEALGRVARQRLVYDLLADEIAGGVHALSLKTLTPSEDTWG